MATLLVSASLCLLMLPAFAESERPTPTPTRHITAQEPQRPAPLERWRQIQNEAKDAMRAPDAEARVERLEAFLEAHPNHLDLEKPLKTLVDSYLELDDFDADRVAALVERMAAEDEESWYAPLNLVRSYHVKHELPVASGDRLMEEARRRIATEREKASEESEDEADLEREMARLDYYVAATTRYQAELRLIHEDAEGAAPLLDKAAKAFEEQPRGIAVQDPTGATVLELESGLDDSLHLMQSLTALRLGQESSAREHFTAIRVVGNDPRQREWADEIRSGLQLARPEGLEATGEPTKAQPFTLEDLTGEEVSLSDYEGKVVLLAFWATWCGPCRAELPELQKFAQEHEGVELLGVSIDRFEDRPQIKPFLEDNNLDFRVLLEDAEQLTDYNYRGIPALYVVDREGKIAEARTGYDPQFKEKLEGKILAIAKGEPTPGRVLLRVEKAPERFGVLWQQPVAGSADVVAIAPPLAGSGGEVALVSRGKLIRFDSTGAELGAAQIRDARWIQGLRAQDLDGNGNREWIVADYRDVKVLDSAGELYWKHDLDGRVTLIEAEDAGSNRASRIVVRAGDKLVALGMLPEEVWSTEEIEDLSRVHALESGAFFVQSEEEFFEVSPEGELSDDKRTLPEGRFLSGRIEGHDVFEGRYDTTPKLRWDVDGDGRRDIVLPRGNSVVAFDVEGRELLRIDGEDNSFELTMGDLDGNPGDELAIFVQHYGLVVLGKPARRASR